MATRKSTIYDLAKLADVSASTVSAILNGTWKERRIAAKTVEKVQLLAAEQQYTLNRQASGLRTSKSGLIGMLIPLHNSRFFGTMAQTFEVMARARGLYPIVVSTLRDPALELETASALISYRIESLMVLGATDPDAVSRLCTSHGVAHVNVDLPGTLASSVISDNYWGAQQLTACLLLHSTPQRVARRNKLYFLGGVASDYATRRRVDGFSDTLTAQFGLVEPGQIEACGYESSGAEAAIKALYLRLGGLPRALFINSTMVLEGVILFLKTLPAAELARCTFGCYDWDPFAAYLSFPLWMVRQDDGGLLGAAFDILDAGSYAEGRVVEIKPALLSM
ncbi:LacI family DNA-binding transcriptional regulator [Rhodoferax sp.]|uniref:LacI family DNA-binding transcriptional regulator n=1 Tax=Rhodoferax sp. TaxID=50421 RepID=UPI0025FCF94B|nr:LacI family DNA-binding transcriptional regulator [Rhodoferax sp.]